MKSLTLVLFVIIPFGLVLVLIDLISLTQEGGKQKGGERDDIEFEVSKKWK